MIQPSNTVKITTRGFCNNRFPFMGSFVQEIDFHTIAKSPSGYFLCFMMYTFCALFFLKIAQKD